MKKWLLTAAVLSLAACARETIPDDAPQPVQATTEEPGSVFVPGKAEVLFSDEMLALIEPELLSGAVKTKSSHLNEAVSSLGIISMERIFPVDPEFEDRHRAFGLHRWYRVTFDDSIPVTKANTRMESLAGVEAVLPVYRIYSPSQPVNDPMFNRQWHYQNTAKTWADVNIVPVWENYTMGNSSVIVSVVDTGVDGTHEDLAANFIPVGPNGSQNFMIGYSANKLFPEDHGTHVAGTIAAVTNNGIGVAGIAGGNAAKGIGGAKIMSCQILREETGGDCDDAAAIVWGADHGAVISNNSWGYKFKDQYGNYDKAAAKAAHDYAVKSIDEAPSSFKSAVEYFNANAGMKGSTQTGPMAGGIVFFAAGNDGQPYGAPGCYPGCMSVGAMTSYGTRSNFSNYGDWVDICAPGVDVLSTVVGNGYETMSGTSMACPHVTGVAALVISYCGGPNFTRQQLWDKLIGGGNGADIPASYRIGPLVDALGALSYGSGEPPSPVTDMDIVSVVSNIVTVSLTVPGDKDGHPAYGFRLLASKSASALAACDPKNPGNDIVQGSFLTHDAAIGQTITGSMEELDFSSHYYVAVSAYDYGRNFSAISNVKEIDTGINHAPVITTSYEGDFKFHVHDRFTIPFSIVDPDGHVVNVEFEKDPADEGNALRLLESVKPGEYWLQVLGNASPEGVYHSTLKAWDNYGMQDSYPITFEILPNSAPELVKQPENILLTYAGETRKVDMGQYIHDPEGEILSYTFDISDRSVVHVTQSTGSEVISVSALVDSGLATVKLSTTDAGGLSISTSFQVLVRGENIEVQAYPNPVINTLYIGTGIEKALADITLLSPTGVTLYSASQECSAFEPATIDMGAAAPGVYTLKVETGGKKYESRIVKQ